MSDDNPYEFSDAGSNSRAELPAEDNSADQGPPGCLVAAAVIVVIAIAFFVFADYGLTKLSSSTIAVFGLFSISASGFGLVAASYLFRSRAIYLAGACCSLGGIAGVLCLYIAWILGFQPFGLD